MFSKYGEVANYVQNISLKVWTDENTWGTEAYGRTKLIFRMKCVISVD